MTNITVFGDHEPNTLAQLADVASRAERAALMADGHLGYVMPIGGVAAYREQVSVVGVGFDIACGNAAIRTDLTPRRHAGSRRSAAGDRRRDPAMRSRSASAARTSPTTRRWIMRCSRARRGTPCPRNTARGAAQQGARAARHGRQRQSLRRRLRRRSGRDLGRRPFRQPRVRAHGRVRVPRALAGRCSGARARPSARCCCRSTSRSGTTTGR